MIDTNPVVKVSNGARFVSKLILENGEEFVYMDLQPPKEPDQSGFQMVIYVHTTFTVTNEKIT